MQIKHGVKGWDLPFISVNHIHWIVIYIKYLWYTYQFLFVEAHLSYSHVSCLLQIGPWSVHNGKIIHLATCITVIPNMYHHYYNPYNIKLAVTSCNAILQLLCMHTSTSGHTITQGTEGQWPSVHLPMALVPWKFMKLASCFAIHKHVI